MYVGILYQLRSTQEWTHIYTLYTICIISSLLRKIFMLTKPTMEHMYVPWLNHLCIFLFQFCLISVFTTLCVCVCVGGGLHVIFTERGLYATGRAYCYAIPSMTWMPVRFLSLITKGSAPHAAWLTYRSRDHQTLICSVFPTVQIHHVKTSSVHLQGA